MSKSEFGFEDNPAKPLCLEFANTVSWHSSDTPKEKLTEYSELVSWGIRVGLIGDSEGAALFQESRRDLSRAARVHRRAIALREAIYRIFRDVSDGRRPSSTDIDILNEAVSEAYGVLRIVGNESGFTWTMAGEKGLDVLLWPVAKSAADLLTRGELGRVRRCANDVEGCGWLFIDTTKNGNRRWCDMSDCGNRAKARRYYQRVKETRHTEGTN
ncbi:MAG: ABATE domain-containing protein [Thaumarchaeota archaeon]|nr:ABATE domain-containing protein [Nitrososphaerota archaeon]